MEKFLLTVMSCQGFDDKVEAANRVLSSRMVCGRKIRYTATASDPEI